MEFEKYDTAAAKYYKKQKIKPTAFISWDFYGTFYNKTKNALNDVTTLNKLISEKEGKIDWFFKDELLDNSVILMTDTNLKIVFASKNIIEMNGYQPDEVVGKTPKMFQGKLTDTISLKEIREAVSLNQSFEKTITNYCKDGTTYQCHIKGFPVFNTSGLVTNFIAFEKIAV